MSATNIHGSSKKRIKNYHNVSRNESLHARGTQRERHTREGAGGLTLSAVED